MGSHAWGCSGPNPLLKQGHWRQLPCILSSLVLIISTDGGYVTMLGSLFQCSATLSVKDEMFHVSVCTSCLLSYHWAYEESDFFTAVHQILINITKSFSRLSSLSSLSLSSCRIHPGPSSNFMQWIQWQASVFISSTGQLRTGHGVPDVVSPCCLEGGLLSLSLQAVFFLMEPRMLGHKGALLAHGQFVGHQDLKGLLCRGVSLITFSKVLFGVCSCSKVEFLNFSEIVQLINAKGRRETKGKKM